MVNAPVAIKAVRTISRRSIGPSAARTASPNRNATLVWSGARLSSPSISFMRTTDLIRSPDPPDRVDGLACAMPQRPFPLLLLLPVMVVTAVTLTGCSQISHALHKTHEETFESLAAAQKGWVGVPVPSWLPADATHINNLATIDETNSVVLVRSSSPLPKSCKDATRTGIPFDQPDWAPTFERFPDRVERCGDYEVVKTKTGWFGWFSATRAGQTPTPS